MAHREEVDHVGIDVLDIRREAGGGKREGVKEGVEGDAVGGRQWVG